MSTSEAKTLPPSDKKLRDARKKGQVAQQRDMGSVIALATGCLFLWIALPRLIDLGTSALEAATLGIADPRARIDAMIPGLVREAAELMGLLILFLTAAIVVTNVVVHAGPVFSLETVTPKMSNMDPVKGIGRIFGVRGQTEFAKNLVRLILGAAATALILWQGIPALLNAPWCGLSCELQLLGTILVMLFIAYVLIGIVFAVPDIKLQQWVHKRQMKMTKTEMKREQRDSNGTPEIKGAQRRIRAEIAQTETRLGGRNATLVIFDEDVAVALRYVKAEVGVPMVVARAAGTAAAARLLATAQMHVVPLWRDGALAKRILSGARLAHPVPQETFEDVAAAMAGTGTGPHR